jgi:hydrogenase-4 component B
MLLGKAILGLGCLVFGLGAPLIAPRIVAVVAGLLDTPVVPVSAAFSVFPGDVAQAALSTPLVAVLLIGFLVLPLLLLVLYGGVGAGSRLDPTPWACGYRYIPQMTYSSHAFAQPLQIIFRPLYLFSATLKEFGLTTGAYFSTRVAYLVQVEDMWEKFIGRPLARGVQGLGSLIQFLQMGNVRLYCTYIIVALVILLVTIRL